MEFPGREVKTIRPPSLLSIHAWLLYRNTKLKLACLLLFAKLDVETDDQNLQLINGHFATISCHFLAPT